MLVALAGCVALPPSLAPTSAAPTAAPTSASEATAGLLRAPTAAPSPAPALRPYTGSLALAPIQPDPQDCAQPSPLDLPTRSLEPLAFVSTGVCGSNEIGLFELGGRRYLAQAAFG